MSELREVIPPPITIPPQCFICIGGVSYENHGQTDATLRFERVSAEPPECRAVMILAG